MVDGAVVWIDFITMQDEDLATISNRKKRKDMEDLIASLFAGGIQKSDVGLMLLLGKYATDLSNADAIVQYVLHSAQYYW